MTDPTFTSSVLLLLLDVHYNPVTEGLLGPLPVCLSQANQILSDCCGTIKMNNTPGWLGDLLPVYRLVHTLDCLDTLEGKGALCATKQEEKSPTNQESHHMIQCGGQGPQNKADINDIN